MTWLEEMEQLRAAEIERQKVLDTKQADKFSTKLEIEQARSAALDEKTAALDKKLSDAEQGLLKVPESGFSPSIYWAIPVVLFLWWKALRG